MERLDLLGPGGEASDYQLASRAVVVGGLSRCLGGSAMIKRMGLTWLTVLAMMPIKRPTKGFDVVVRSCSAKSFTKNVIDELIKPMLTKNR